MLATNFVALFVCLFEKKQHRIKYLCPPCVDEEGKAGEPQWGPIAWSSGCWDYTCSCWHLAWPISRLTVLCPGEGGRVGDPLGKSDYTKRDRAL